MSQEVAVRSSAHNAVARRPESREVTLEGKRIGFRNFSGAEGKFNAAGDRNFVVFLDPDEAAWLEKQGWAVKYLAAREEGEPDQAFLKIKMKFGGKGRPPRIVMIGSRGQAPVPEEMLDILDWADIESTDLIIRPYDWDISGKKGRSAYLVAIYVTIREDELERKYADVPINTGMAALTGGNEIFDGEIVEDYSEER